MGVLLNPYLSFKGNARQAMAFYHGIFGGKLVQNTFKDYQASNNPDDDDKIMHAQLEGENGIVFMASDTTEGMEHHQGSSITMSLSGDNDKDISGYFQKLAEGGKITMPLEAAPWGDKFGMLTDKFGTDWMANISPKKA